MTEYRNDHQSTKQHLLARPLKGQLESVDRFLFGQDASSSCKSSCFSSFWPRILALAVLSVGALSSCSLAHITLKAEHCKIHTYINLLLPDYVSQRFSKGEMTRLAIVPFDVPETFAPVGNESRNFGRDLARRFEVELHRTNPVPIVELFNRDRWPGKRDEFFTGNYGAISYARAAGYDFVMVGYLEDLKNDTDLTLYTKIIDTQNQVTVWHSKVIVVSDSRDWGKALASMRLGKYNPSDFSFSERANELAACTVDAIASEDSEPVPE